jgi:hypothetical protein
MVPDKRDPLVQLQHHVCVRAEVLAVSVEARRAHQVCGP